LNAPTIGPAAASSCALDASEPTNALPSETTDCESPPIAVFAAAMSSADATFSRLPA
jgi:hypothetical protein